MSEVTVDLRVWRQFVVLAEELHFGRAALRLHMTQPPLTQAIAQLETTLGVRLFERSRRHVALSPAGEALLPEARELLARAQRLPGVARSAAAGEVGRLRLAFVSPVGFELLPQWVRGFRAHSPGVALDLIEATGDVQQAALAHCGGKMRNRVAILDVWQGYKPRQHPDGDCIDNFRGKLGINYLDFATAYYPWLNTSIVQERDLSYQNLAPAALLQQLLKQERNLPDELPKLPDTATAADIDSLGQHPEAPASGTSTGPWAGRLTGIGSEWSRQFPGYVAGAIEAASVGVRSLVAFSRS